MNTIESSLSNRLANWKRASRAISAGFKFNQLDGDLNGDNNCCTVIALSNVTGISFADAQAIAASAGRRRGRGFSSPRLIAAAAQRGFNFKHVWDDTSLALSGGKGISVKSFCERFSKGRFYVRISGHAFTIIDGVVEDRFQPKALARITDAWEFTPVVKASQYANPY